MINNCLAEIRRLVYQDDVAKNKEICINYSYSLCFLSLKLKKARFQSGNLLITSPTLRLEFSWNY